MSSSMLGYLVKPQFQERCCSGYTVHSHPRQTQKNGCQRWLCHQPRDAVRMKPEKLSYHYKWEKCLRWKKWTCPKGHDTNNKKKKLHTESTEEHWKWKKKTLKLIQTFKAVWRFFESMRKILISCCNLYDNQRANTIKVMFDRLFTEKKKTL